MSKKRALESFFTPRSQKKVARHITGDTQQDDLDPSAKLSHHTTYPFPVPHLPDSLIDGLAEVPFVEGKVIDNQLDLDLVYFQPYVPPSIERDLFHFLRCSLFFYRVKYKIKRGALETDINTPRYTTVFGVDTSSVFSRDTNGEIFLAESANPSKAVPRNRYQKCHPRPIPDSLDHLRRLTEIITNAEYNFCLVNYYSSGDDSISYHSDDEHFLGPNPSIASFSLGATRDFCMKHKTIAPSTQDPEPEQNKKTPLKLPLASGDMVLMRGATQANWLHSIPKRKGKGVEGGRINITFRKGVKIYATENYYNYNVGNGPVYKWDEKTKEMKEWKREAGASGPSSV